MKQNIQQRIQIYRKIEKVTFALELAFEFDRKEICRLPNQYLDQYIDGKITLDDLKYGMMIYRRRLKNLVSPWRTLSENRKFLEDNREMIQDLERSIRPRGPFDDLY